MRCCQDSHFTRYFAALVGSTERPQDVCTPGSCSQYAAAVVPPLSSEFSSFCSGVGRSSSSSSGSGLGSGGMCRQFGCPRPAASAELSIGNFLLLFRPASSPYIIDQYERLARERIVTCHAQPANDYGMRIPVIHDGTLGHCLCSGRSCPYRHLAVRCNIDSPTIFVLDTSNTSPSETTWMPCRPLAQS